MTRDGKSSVCESCSDSCVLFSPAVGTYNGYLRIIIMLYKWVEQSIFQNLIPARGAAGDRMIIRVAAYNRLSIERREDGCIYYIYNTYLYLINLQSDCITTDECRWFYSQTSCIIIVIPPCVRCGIYTLHDVIILLL